jgi:hypothetical protein
MVVADPTGGWFVSGIGYGSPRAKPLPAGVSMVTAYDPNDRDSPRTARHLPRFQAAEPSWNAWHAILSDQRGDPADQINVVPRGGFGTVSSSFLTLSAHGQPIWLFAAGPPHRAVFLRLNLRQRPGRVRLGLLWRGHHCYTRHATRTIAAPCHTDHVPAHLPRCRGSS